MPSYKSRNKEGKRVLLDQMDPTSGKQIARTPGGRQRVVSRIFFTHSRATHTRTQTCDKTMRKGVVSEASVQRPHTHSTSRKYSLSLIIREDNEQLKETKHEYLNLTPLSVSCKMLATLPGEMRKGDERERVKEVLPSHGCLVAN
jgi:hypothetical protein